MKRLLLNILLACLTPALLAVFVVWLVIDGGDAEKAAERVLAWFWTGGPRRKE